MATKTLKGKAYFYLEHTIRSGGRRTTRSKYLGRKLPSDIARVEREFLAELDRTRWFDDFERIRRGYNRELRATPRSVREKELREFSIRFTYDTQRIEGSTLTLRETALLLADRLSPSGRPIGDAKEAEAHARVFFGMLALEKDLSQKLVQEWNWELLKDTKPDVAGQIRRHGVRISGSEFIPPSPVEVQPLLNEFFTWYDEARTGLNPVELAALVHLKFVTIHPFSDGNGRVSRLMMNCVLSKHGYPMLNIEYRGRAAYYKALERSQLRKDERAFKAWLFRRYKHEYRRFLAG